MKPTERAAAINSRRPIEIRFIERSCCNISIHLYRAGIPAMLDNLFMGSFRSPARCGRRKKAGVFEKSNLTFHRAQKLERCRELLGRVPAEPAADPPADYRDRFETLIGQSLRVCRHWALVHVWTAPWMQEGK
jgi:hypothetical protein